MTTIAWDGKTLAADKRFTIGGCAATGTKIFHLEDLLVGFSGSAAQAMEMLAWLEAGEDPEEFPASQRDADDAVAVLVVRKGGWIDVYERTPFPMRIEDKFYAMGSGRDYALAAMHLGKTAREAVEVSCVFEVDCGNGIDELKL